VTEYEKSYKKMFIAYHDLYYAPINNQEPDMSTRQSGHNSRSKYLYSSRHRAVLLSEALGYLETNSAIEPHKADAEVTDPTREACPGGTFLRGKYTGVVDGECRKISQFSSDG